MPPDSEFVASIICPGCHAELPAGDELCRRCGASTSLVVHATVADATKSAERTKQPAPSMMDSRWFVLSMLFGVTMFTGLPLLWKSRAFDRNGKIMLTILVIVYSIVVFWLFFLIMNWCYQSIRQHL